jgi:O-acetylhomoserine/O-acetylserine sulfhydrylase-like pyridoxal-dependent enzyme
MDMKIISQTDNEVISAFEIQGGIIIKSVTKNSKQQSESMIEIKGGVIVNHGTFDEPVWKLNR